MSLPDLSRVTEVLRDLLETQMPAYPGWPAAIASVDVSVRPPDLRANDTNLGLYLYHVAQEAHFKNDPGTGPGGGSNRDKPLALNLYYQLSAAAGDDENSALQSQTLMSFAIRTFYDHTILTDETRLTAATEPLFETHGLFGRGNRIRIALRPVPPDDAVDYWTAGEAPLRLAAYYQVSVVMLEPAPAVRATSPVLSYGAAVFATGGPTLASSRSTTEIVVADDAAARSVPFTPAQVTLTPGPAVPGGTFEVQGSQLLGEGTGMRLRGDYGTFDIDVTQWGVVASAERVFARVGAAIGEIPTMPGTWNVSILVRKTVSVGGASKAVVHDSNETPILIAPRLDAVSPTGPTLGDVSVGVDFTLSGWRFAGSEVLAPPDPGPYPLSINPADVRSVRLLIAGQRLVRTVADAALTSDGEFRVVDATTLEARLPAGLPLGSLQAVQVWVNGVASAPQWLRVVP